MKQLHSYDSGGPYAGFKGAVNFYREIDRMVNSKVWKYLKAPWQETRTDHTAALPAAEHTATRMSTYASQCDWPGTRRGQISCYCDTPPKRSTSARP